MNLLKLFYIALVAVLVSSCISYKNIQYAREGSGNSTYNIDRKSKIIKPFDELYVKVLSTDEKTSAIFSVETRLASYTDLHLVSYTVNEEGNIFFPFVGKILVKDLTLEEASEKIQSALSQYLLNTSVRVRFINNNITILGAVTKEGTYNFSTDKLSIFQAVGIAGGITPYGDRKKVTIMRVVDSKVTYNEVNLTDKDIVESKFYYIEPNDVIIVKPVRAITHTFRNNTYASALATIGTLVTVLLFIKTY